MSISLRTRLLAAMLATVALTVLLAGWAMNARIAVGARREADAQVQARVEQTRALYEERAATLAAEAEVISLYPAVVAAIADGNPRPLLTWSGQVAERQRTSVTVVDATGTVIARGHAPERTGDALAPSLEGLRLALTGKNLAGTELGDELGLAIRGYAPVTREGAVVGAVMIADPLNERLLTRLLGANATGESVRVEPGASTAEGCERTSDDGSALCRFAARSPSGATAATLAVSVPLTSIRQARVDAQRAVWIVGGLALLLGATGAWLLARSLTRPLACLTASAERIAGGDYTQPVDVRRTDEIGVLARALETMRAEVSRAAAALRDERDVVNAVLESAGDGILMTDPSGTPLVSNARWRDLLGGDGLDGAASLTRAGGSDDTLAASARRWLAEPDRLLITDFEAFDPYRRFRVYSAPVEGVRGAEFGVRDIDTVSEFPGRDSLVRRTPHIAPRTVLGRIFVLRDVTAETEAERMRGALVSTVSHELRSPLTAISGYAESLISGGPWDTQTEREFLEIIALSAWKLAGLVDNLLDAAKLEAGVLRLDREPVRVERIARQVAAHRQPLTPNHRLYVEVDADLPLADADPMRVEQVVTNLVENAIKYSPQGGPVTIRVRGGDALTISISDRGVGIAPEDVERLFERFYRVDSSLSRATKGVGLGLFICRSLVEAHGGRLWVESTPGQGSTFSFTLPSLHEPTDAAARTPAVAIA